MRNRALPEKIGRFFKTLYLKLFRINDTPQKVATGLGLGVFLGIIPGTGPLVAIFLAFVFRVNRAAALLGSLITNTWMSIPVFLLSVKIGAMLTGLEHQEIHRRWSVFIKDFRWSALLDISIYKMIGPVLAGYLAISLCIGAACYIMALMLLKYFKCKKDAGKK